MNRRYSGELSADKSRYGKDNESKYGRSERAGGEANVRLGTQAAVLILRVDVLGRNFR